MKKAVVFQLVMLLLGTFIARAQIIVFHEDFEQPSLADSVTATTTPIQSSSWGVCTSLHSQGARSDTCQVKTGKTCYLTSNAFSTLGNYYVRLYFDQICKIDFADKAQIQVSPDGGANWFLLTQVNYSGSAIFGSNANSFSSNSYSNLWQPGVAGAIPDNTWWRTEAFDCSVYLSNTPNAMIRFKLSDLGTAGNAGNFGWCLDNIKVSLTFSELVPPAISILSPVCQGFIYSPGPFPVKAKITDYSGIDTAYIMYTVNNGPLLSVGMHHTGADSMTGNIPALPDSSEVRWYVSAVDNSAAHNLGREPLNSTLLFNIRSAFEFPYFETFDAGFTTPPWSTVVLNNQSDWQLGTPAFSYTSSAHSNPNAWDINLNTYYGLSANNILTTPAFNFSQVSDAVLSFWRNNLTMTTGDGVRLEYSTDSTVWNVLGSVNDGLGTNWYNQVITSSNLPAWSGYSTGWVKSTYKLSILNNVSLPVRFRFVFTSTATSNLNNRIGFSIDDFSIVEPSAQEAVCNSITLPGQTCNIGLDTIRIDIRNTGLNPILAANHNCSAGYYIINTTTGAISPNVIEPVNIDIPVNGIIHYHFQHPFNFDGGTNGISYTIKSWVSVAGDINHLFDTLSANLISLGVPAVPAVTSQSVPYGSTATLNATIPGGIYCYWYQSCSGNPISSGTSFVTPNLYSSPSIYFVKANNSSGCSSACVPDTIFVSPIPAADVSVTRLISPVSGYNLSATEPVRICIRNYGTQVINDYWLHYSTGANTVNQHITTLPLAAAGNPGDSLQYTFTVPANLSVYQTYTLSAWIDGVAGDTWHLNDTVTRTVQNHPYTYCNSEAWNMDYSDIGNFTLSNVSNGTAFPVLNNANANNTYTDFTQQADPIFLIRGQSFPVSVSQISSYSVFAAALCKIYCDWQWDGTLDPVSDLAFTGGPTTSAGAALTGIITVPSNAHLGPTRLRVVLNQTTIPANVTPCNIYSMGETEDYTAMILPAMPRDAGVIRLNTPAASFPAGQTYSPIVTIINSGTDTITSLDIYFVMNNQPQTVNWTLGIAPGDTTQVAFASFLMPAGVNTFIVYTSLAGDAYTFNDTLHATITGVPLFPIPFSENFDGSTPSFYPETLSSTEWILGAPAPGSFPVTCVSAPNIWATNLNNSLGYYSSAYASLLTPYFDLSNAAYARLSFWYKCDAYSNDGTTLFYSTDYGHSWQVLGIYNDPNGTNWYNQSQIYSDNHLPGWSSLTSNWTYATYNLASLGNPACIRFKFLFTSYSGAYHKPGMAIDNFTLSMPVPNDAGIEAVFVPSPVDSGSIVFPHARLKNNSGDTLFTIPVKLQVDNNPLQSYTWSSASGLAPGDTITTSLSVSYVVPAGDYTLKVYTDNPGDINPINDTITRKDLFGIPTYGIPYFCAFDSSPQKWYKTGTQWQHGTPASSPINYAFSPTDCWKTRLNSHYINDGQFHYLYSPKFQFIPGGLDSLKFYHWVDIYAYDFCWVEYKNTSGAWVKMGTLNDGHARNWYNAASGFSVNGGLGGWHQSAFWLSALSDKAMPLQFRFAFHPTSSSNAWDGWAIDNVQLSSDTAHLDVGVRAVREPAAATTYGMKMCVKAVIQNFGLDTVHSVPLQFTIDGAITGSDVWTGALAPGDTAVHYFDSIPVPIHSFDICSYTLMPGDGFSWNDSSCHHVIVYPPQYDVLPLQVLSPVGYSVKNEPSPVNVIIKNNGYNPVHSVLMTYYVPGTAILRSEYFILPGGLSQGNTESYLFDQTLVYADTGAYTLCVVTYDSLDHYHANDTLCISLHSYVTGIGLVDEQSFSLGQAVPNPSDKTASISFFLPFPGEINFMCLNSLGQKIMSFHRKETNGRHSINISTSEMADGLYYYYMIYKNRKLARKIIVQH